MTRRALGNLAAWLLPLVLFWGAIWVGIERTFGR